MMPVAIHVVSVRIDAMPVAVIARRRTTVMRVTVLAVVAIRVRLVVAIDAVTAAVAVAAVIIPAMVVPVPGLRFRRSEDGDGAESECCE